MLFLYTDIVVLLVLSRKLFAYFSPNRAVLAPCYIRVFFGIYKKCSLRFMKKWIIYSLLALSSSMSVLKVNWLSVFLDCFFPKWRQKYYSVIFVFLVESLWCCPHEIFLFNSKGNDQVIYLFFVNWWLVTIMHGNARTYKKMNLVLRKMSMVEIAGR